MIKAFQLTYLSPTKQSRLLSVLFSIYEEPHASQHKIAVNTGLSSSMVNNYIKWLKVEGFINVLGKTNRTQQYHLSEAGRENLPLPIRSPASLKPANTFRLAAASRLN